MDQGVAVAFASGLTLFTFGTVWPAAVLPGRISESPNRINKCRAMLQDEAVQTLSELARDVNVALQAAGGGGGVSAIKVSPDSLKEPALRYLKIVQLDDQVERLPAVVQSRSKRLLPASLFVALVALAALIQSLFLYVGNESATQVVLLVALLVAVGVGGGFVLHLARAKRRLDEAFARANDYETSLSTVPASQIDWGDS